MTKSIYTFPSYNPNSRSLSFEVVDKLNCFPPAKLRYLLSILQQVKRLDANYSTGACFRKRHTGICLLVRILQIDTSSMYLSDIDLEELIPLWPCYSGVLHYPVPHPSLSSLTAYDRSAKLGLMWDRRTTYGKLRHDLLGWMIHQLKTYLVYYLHDRHALHQNRGA